MARIPFPNPQTMTSEQRRVYDDIVKGRRGEIKGPLLAALHQPELADHWQKLGKFLRYDTSLTPSITELAILVTARYWDCSLEWYFHEPVALDAGIDTAVIDAIKNKTSPVFSNDTEATAYQFTQEIHNNKTVPNALYEKALALWGVVGVVELTAVIGYYTMVAITLNTHQYALPDNAINPFADTV